MDKQKQARKESSRSRVSEESTFTQEKMKTLIDNCIKAKTPDLFKKESEIVTQILDPSKKEWVPSKVKKQIVDSIKDIIKGPPKQFSAQQKLLALQLLNRCIIKKNQEFNRYVEVNLMARLAILAQFNPADNDDSDDPLNITHSSIQNTAQEILTRGQRIFGPDEKDLTTSAQFLVLLLDFIEKWSKISYEKPMKHSDDQKAYTFQQVFIDLHDVKDIVFPSNHINKGQEPPKKAVTFAKQDSDGSCNKSECSSISKIDPEKKKAIYSLKRKMLRVKEAAKKCKRYLCKVERQENEDPKVKKELQEIFAINRKISVKVVHFLKPEEFGTYISNSQDLIVKMKKYSEKFEEALDHLNLNIGQKSVSYVVPPLEGLDMLRLSDAKSIEKQPQNQLNPSPPVQPKECNEDFWSFNHSASTLREDPQNQVPLMYDDEFILGSQRTVVIDNGIGFDPTKPRYSEQIKIDLDMDSQFDFEVNEERTTNSLITPDESSIYYNNFDDNFLKQENSELRKPRQPKVDDQLVKQLQDEIKQLKNEIQRIKDQQFEESEIAMEMTMAISNANIELQKTKQEHKKEIMMMKKVHDELKNQIQKFQQEMKNQSEELDAKTAQIITFEEYHEAYRKQITHLQEKLADKFYDPDKEESSVILSPKVKDEGKSSFFSPLNFSNLLIVGSEAEKAESLEKQKDSIKTDFSESHHPNSSGSRASGKPNKDDPFSAKVIRSPQDKYDSDDNSLDSDDAPRSVTETHAQRDSHRFRGEDSSADKLRTQKQTSFMQKLNKMKQNIQQPPATIVRKSNEQLGLNKK